MCNVHGINNLNPCYAFYTDCFGDGKLWNPDSDGVDLTETRPPCPYCDPVGFRRWATQSARDHAESVGERRSIMSTIDKIIALACAQNGKEAAAEPTTSNSNQPLTHWMPLPNPPEDV